MDRKENTLFYRGRRSGKARAEAMVWAEPAGQEEDTDRAEIREADGGRKPEHIGSLYEPQERYGTCKTGNT